MTEWTVPRRSDGRPDGAALHRRWDDLLDRAARAAADARRQARAQGDDATARWFGVQESAMRGLKSLSASRLWAPGPQLGTGAMHDIPGPATEPGYEPTMALLGRVVELWRSGLGATGWDWTVDGYPPGWGIRPLSVLANIALLPGRRRSRRARD